MGRSSYNSLSLRSPWKELNSDTKDMAPSRLAADGVGGWVVSPTRWSLLFIFGFLCWSSSGWVEVIRGWGNTNPVQCSLLPLIEHCKHVDGWWCLFILWCELVFLQFSYLPMTVGHNIANFAPSTGNKYQSIIVFNVSPLYIFKCVYTWFVCFIQYAHCTVYSHYMVYSPLCILKCHIERI